MNDDLDRRLRDARDGLHRTPEERVAQLEAAVVEEVPAGSLRRGRRRAIRGRRRWAALALALLLTAGASAVASGRLGDLFSDDPPPEVSRAFLLSGGGEASDSPRGTTSDRRPPSTVAARLVVADTPWGRYTYWRGLDDAGQVEDLVQDPSDVFAGGSPCLAFDPVIPPTDRTRIPVPDVIGLPARTARARLAAVGFSTRTGRRPLDPAHVVLGTRPAIGSPTFEGTPVEIFLGPERLVRPAAPLLPRPTTGAIMLCGAGTNEPNRTPTVLNGAVSAEVASAEIGYADGRSMPAFVSNRSILVVVPPQTCAFGLEPPRTLVLRDRGGDEIDRLGLGERGFDLGGWEANGPPLCGPQPDPPAGGTDALFSVLTRPATPEDALPAPIGGSGPQHLRPGSSRRATDLEGWRFYAVTARPYPAAPETVCLVDVRLGDRLRARRGQGFVFGPGGSGGSSCPAADVFLTSFQVSVLRLAPDGTADVAGLVPDGFTTVSAGARRSPVVGNVYALRDVPLGTVLRAEGPAGTRTALFGGRTGALPPSDRRIVAR